MENTQSRTRLILKLCKVRDKDIPKDKTKHSNEVWNKVCENEPTANNKQPVKVIAIQNGNSEIELQQKSSENVNRVQNGNKEEEPPIAPTNITNSNNYLEKPEELEIGASSTEQSQAVLIYSKFFEEKESNNTEPLRETRIEIDNLEKVEQSEKGSEKEEHQIVFNYLQLVNGEEKENIQSKMDEKEKENIHTKMDEKEKENTDPEINEDSNENKYSEIEENQEMMFDSDDTDEDPNYDASEDTSSNEETSSDDAPRQRKADSLHAEESIAAKRGRKRKRNMKNWATVSSKKLRNTGKSYISYKTKKEVKGRELKGVCPEKCKQKCREKFTEDERKTIFNNYWQLGDLHRQRDFIAASMIKVVPAYRYVREGSSRKANNAFYFENDGKRLRVCKVFFMNTLDINHRVIRTVIEKKLNLSTSIVSEDLRGKHNSHKQIDEQIKNGAREHISSIPKIPSHYCRADSSRDYIDGSKTIAQIYRDYVNECLQRNAEHVNYVMFYRIFTEEFNLSFFTPKKDQCEQCVAYQNASNVEKDNLKENYDRHLVEKDLARKEKKIDKEEGSTSIIVTCYDLQAVFQCPKGDISVFYYKSKLNVLNLTFYELKTNDVTCFVWHEGEAERGVNEIGSCVLRYIEKKALSTKDQIEFIFYTDNCSGQQKNRFMIRLYQYAIHKFPNIKSITHKFLIKGHTQNEGDSAHSMIERQVKQALRSGPIYTPDHFINIIRCAKKTGRPYIVIELTHEDFYNIKGLTNSQDSFKNTDKQIVRISDIKVMKITRETPSSFFYKTSYMESELKEVDMQSKKSSLRGTSTNDRLVLQPAYSKKRTFPEKKKTDLLDLIRHNHIPKYYAPFYNNL